MTAKLGSMLALAMGLRFVPRRKDTRPLGRSTSDFVAAAGRASKTTPRTGTGVQPQEFICINSDRPSVTEATTCEAPAGRRGRSREPAAPRVTSKVLTELINSHARKASTLEAANFADDLI